MNTKEHFLQNLWRWAIGAPEVEESACQVIKYDDAFWQTEWSTDFEKLMRNRLVMGAMRYGPMHSLNKPQYDRLKSIHKRIDQYEKTGNLEYLVDVANLALLEFEESGHPNKHFAAIDGEQDHVSVLSKS